MTSLKNLLGHDVAPYPVSSRIISELAIADVYNLHRVCWAFHHLQGYLRKTRLNINIHLERFVADGRRFREHLGRHDGLVAGGFALEFFEPGPRPTPYLDVFIGPGPGADEFARYLRGEEDYKTRGDAGEDDEGHHGGEATQYPLVFLHADRKGMIRLTQTDDTPLLHVLQSACTTANANFITRDKAYCLFPALTTKHRFYPLRGLNNEVGRALAELNLQGWTTRDVAWPDSGSTLKKLRRPAYRRVGDRSSFIVPFVDGFLSPTSTPGYVIEHAQFYIGDRSSAPKLNQLQQHAFFAHIEPQSFPGTFSSKGSVQVTLRLCAIDTHALRHRHLVPPGSWRSFLEERLKWWLVVELYKMDPEARPERFRGDMAPQVSGVSLPPEFTPPRTWDYADDQVPCWYRDWESVSTGDGKFPS